MKNFYRTKKSKVSIFIILSLWIILFPIWTAWITKHPLEEKISLSPLQTIVKTINIRVDESYVLAFRLNIKNLTKEQREKLFYKWIPVTYEITDNDGNVLFLDTTNIAGETSWNGEYIWRDIKGFHLDKGQYQTKIKIDKAVPELTNIETFVEINFGNGKAWSAWQFDVTWWGGLIYPLLVLIEIALAISLVVNFLNFKKDKSSMTS